MATKKAATKKPPEAVKPQKKEKRRNQPLKGKHGGWQLVLIEDVTHLGKQGEVVEVKAGYARNYLLPNSLATVPTPHNLKLLEKYKIRVHQAREAKIADLKVLAEQIKQVNVTVEANATEEGHLYGSVGPAEVSKALRGRNLPVETGNDPHGSADQGAGPVRRQAEPRLRHRERGQGAGGQAAGSGGAAKR